MEAVKTNVIGTDNTLDAAIDAGVKCVICLSTDKAASLRGELEALLQACPANVPEAGGT